MNAFIKASTAEQKRLNDRIAAEVTAMEKRSKDRHSTQAAELKALVDHNKTQDDWMLKDNTRIVGELNRVLGITTAHGKAFETEKKWNLDDHKRLVGEINRLFKALQAELDGIKKQL